MPREFNKFWRALRLNIDVLDHNMIKLGLESSGILRLIRYDNKLKKPYRKNIFQKKYVVS